MSEQGRTEDPTAPATRPRSRKWWWLFGGLLLLLVLLIAGAVSGALWAARSAAGTAWLLARIAPYVTVTGPSGSLDGDFDAERIVVAAGGTRVVIDKASWRGMRITYSRLFGVWTELHVNTVSAERVTVTLTPKKDKSPPITHLRLPIVLVAEKAHVGELNVPGLQGHPMRDVTARVLLGADGNKRHVVQNASVVLAPLRLTGNAHIDTSLPMVVDLHVKAVQASTADAAIAVPSWARELRADWQASLDATGPLAKMNVKTAVRAQGQAMDATAVIAPFDAWPIPQLEASTQGLDLSALLAQAPLTSLTGKARITPSEGKDRGTLTLLGNFTNAKPGRWDARQLPLRSVVIDAHSRADRILPLELTQLDVQLSDGRGDIGRVQGKGRWSEAEAALQAQLTNVQPNQIDQRLPAMSLSGNAALAVQTAASAPAQPAPAASGATKPLFAVPRAFTAQATLTGRSLDFNRPVQMKLDARGDTQRIDLREFTAAVGDAKASLTGTGERSGNAWQVKARAALTDFDPRPWFPIGTGAGWPAGAQKINLRADTNLNLPDSLRTRDGDDKRSLIERFAAVRGELTAQIANSVIGGVAVSGDAALKHTSASDPLQATATLAAEGNTAKLDGRIALDGNGSADRWTAEARLPALARLAPVLRTVLPRSVSSELLANLNGTLEGSAEVNGRWPRVASQGRVAMNGLRAGPWSVSQAESKWNLGTAVDAPLDVQADIAQAAYGGKQLGVSALRLKGNWREHELTAKTELKAAPPQWLDTLQTRQGAQATPMVVRSAASQAAAASSPPVEIAASGPARSASTTTSRSSEKTTRTLITAQAKGGFTGDVFARQAEGKPTAPWSWKGLVQQLEARTTQADAVPMLSVKDVNIEVASGPPMRLTVGAGRADIVGAAMRWNQITWLAGQGVKTQQLDMQAELEPFEVAPFLRRIQPNFGWGGDLRIGGKVLIKQTDTFSADIVLERTKGDLTVTEEIGTQALGLTDLRVGLVAQDGTWNFTAGMAGAQLGELGGALVVRTSPQAAWPAPDAPVQGGLAMRVANLGTWGAWVPAGWRLDGKLNVSASLGGRFNAPEYTGQMTGSGLGVRNLVEGVSLSEGEVDISLRGNTARINKFVAKGGNGTVKLEGDAELDDSWSARLKLTAQNFQALGRVDLRIVTTGEAQMTIGADAINAEGRFTVDEGLVDFTRLSSPGLGDDVVVSGRGGERAPDAPDSTAATGPAGPRVSLNLLVNLGKQLRMRGLGIDTRLEGELRVSRPGGKWALNGTVNAVDGTFANYGQKLAIDRGVITFNGSPATMRLDIEATRPDLDVRVGVAVSGPLSNPRVRLFSEPEMSNNEKLSWLLLGRASDGLGRSDAAMLQRAAFALLSGTGEGGPGAITKKVGIDDISLRQSDGSETGGSSGTTAAGNTKETFVSVGKQLSKRVYLAYEQNLNTSAGSFQVTYRIAQRFVMRLQSGLDRSIDLIGTWRWE